MFNNPKTIKIFLAEGSPAGMKTIELTGWNGKAVSVPRERLREFFSREEASLPAVYFLLSQEPEESGLHRAYIGKAKILKERLTDHDYKKDFWQVVVAFIGGNAEYLESRCLELAIDGKRCILENKNSPVNSILSESEKAEAEEFLGNLSLLLSATGYPILPLGVRRESVKKVEDAKTEGILFCKGGGAEAQGRITEEGFEVLVGSIASKAEPGLSSSKKLKEFLIAEKVLGFNEGYDHYVFSRSYVFSSPSAASNVILSYPNNGREKWKNSNGKSLAELEESV